MSAALRFKATGMVEDDALRISLNDQPIAADRIERRFDADGQSAAEGRQLGPFFHYRFALSPKETRYGDNQLGVRLTRSAGREPIDVQEVEVQVDVP